LFFLFRRPHLRRNNRIRIPHLEKSLQSKILRPLPNRSEFIAYIDAIGTIDGQEFLIEWKTTASRYPEEPKGLLSLDPQLICYSWISGIPEVALVVFVRRRFPEIQYLKASITDEQRAEFGRLVSTTASQIEAGQFMPHSGIRFPMNPARVVRILGFAWEDSRSSIQNSFADPEPRTLIGLTRAGILLIYGATPIATANFLMGTRARSLCW
jgi:hypothetical protein